MTDKKQPDQQNEQDEKSKHYWHPAFQAAMHLAWRKNKHDLEIRCEEELGKMPSIMDMLVIVKKPGLKLEDPIGAGFRGLNILEFKSPSDDMHIDTFYKVLSYACLYKSQGNTMDSRKVDDITLPCCEQLSQSSFCMYWSRQMEPLQSKGPEFTMSRG